MKQKKVIIKLRDVVGKSIGFGNNIGRETYQKLQSVLDEHPESKIPLPLIVLAIKIFGISFDGMEMMDASFARESVISLAKAKRGEVGFYLRDFASKDLQDNWEYAARAKEQPLFVYEGKSWSVLGLDLGEETRKLFDFIIKNENVTTSIVAEKFKLSAPNASMKLKKLLGQGLLIGSKGTAESGGLEYVFSAIK